MAGRSSASSILYWSGQARNAPTTPARAADPPAIINDYRSVPILDDASAYRAAFVRFSIDGASNLPAWQPQMALGSANTAANVRMTAYRLGLQADVAVASAPVFPFTVSLGVNDELVLVAWDNTGAQTVPVSDTVVVAAGVYAAAADLIAAIGVAIAGSSIGPWSLTTCAVQTTTGRCVYTVPAGWRLRMTGANAAAHLMAGSGLDMAVAATSAVSPNAVGLAPADVHETTLFGFSNVWWEPEDTGAIVPAFSALSQDLDTGFYDCFSFSHIAALWTQAYAWAYNDSGSPMNSTPGTASASCLYGAWSAWLAAEGLPQYDLPFQPPVVQWDASAQNWTMSLDKAAFGNGSLAAQTSDLRYPGASCAVTLWNNTAAAYTVSGFDWTYAAVPVAERDASLRVTQASAGLMPDGVSSAWVVAADYPALATLCPVASIALISTTLPLVPEEASEVTGYTAAGDVASAGTADLTQPVLIDVDFSGEPAAVAAGAISYVPYEYRWTSMGSQRLGIRAITLQAMWRSNRDAKLRPVRLAAGGSFEAKILFERLGS